MKTLLDQLEDKILIGDGCWEWTGCLMPLGYGQLRRDGKTVYAHRVMYELMVGPIPEGLFIDHLCRNRKCVRPDHLEAVTNEVNIMRGNSVPARRARQTHCKEGHELAGDNLFVTVRGHRICRTCRRMADRKRQPAKRQRRREREKQAA